MIEKDFICDLPVPAIEVTSVKYFSFLYATNLPGFLAISIHKIIYVKFSRGQLFFQSVPEFHGLNSDRFYRAQSRLTRLICCFLVDDKLFLYGQDDLFKGI